MDEIYSVHSPEAALAAADGADGIRRVSPVTRRSMTAAFRGPNFGCTIFGLILFLCLAISSCAQSPDKIPTNLVVKSTGPPTALGLRILILETDTVVLTTATSLSTDPPLPPSPKTLTPRPVVNNQALPVETPTATAGTCLDVGLVSQTTTTDQSLIFLPGEPFYYSWRILNIGSCIWTVDYQLLSIDASKLGWPNIIRLPNQVPPGETATVITTFFAPQTQGVVAAEWVLTNPEGEPVLIKSSSGENLDLSITVRRKISGKDNDNPEECT